MTRVLPLVLAALVHGAVAADARPPQTQGAAWPVAAVRVVSDAGEVHGTAILIGRDDRADDGATLHFLTAARLFRGPDGSLPRTSRSIRLRLTTGESLDVKPKDVFAGGAGPADVAVLRVTVAHAVAARPAAIVYDAPAVGAVFLVEAAEASGGANTVAQHVRFESTLLVIGDREVALDGCVGAPAIGSAGVFGIVRECQPDRPPVVAVLSMLRPFLERFAPPVRTTMLVNPRFSLLDRDLTESLMLAGCSADAAGELDVPLRLGPGESIVAASAALANPREVPLTDVTVVKLADRSVRLRFTLGSMPGPPAPPTDCPLGRALVTLHVRVAVVPTP